MIRIGGPSVAALAALALGACSVLGPKPEAPARPTEVAPPVAPPAEPARLATRPPPMRQACVPRGLPRAPRYPDTDTALRNAGGAADRYQLMAAGRILRSQRLAELERIVEGCR
jgi:hypothetical protein